MKKKNKKPIVIYRVVGIGIIPADIGQRVSRAHALAVLKSAGKDNLNQIPDSKKPLNGD